MFKRLIYGLAFIVVVASWPIWAPLYWVITGKEWVKVFEKITTNMDA